MLSKKEFDRGHCFISIHVILLGVILKQERMSEKIFIDYGYYFTLIFDLPVGTEKYAPTSIVTAGSKYCP